ncbi:uncharacterized protein [Rutidosis leptorrhynchoides]|uniref:uncharacterized protein n=1 Tax=Rutidosis leptorrhynchoides TaxID=125765 RepID=UPI003A9A0C95
MVAWKMICRPKKQRGLSLRPLKEWNDVLLMKQVWKIISQKESNWWNWVNVVKLKGRDVMDIGQEANDSRGWRQILRLRDAMKTHVHKDNDGTLWWVTGENKLKPYSTGQAWKDLRSNAANVGWCDVIWFPQYTPKHAFICWLAVQQRLATQDRLKIWYPNEVFICSLCGKQEDSHSHLFFKCDFSCQVWENTKKMLVYKGLHNELGLIIKDIARYPAGKDIRNILNRIAITATVYYVWMERNKRQFMKMKKSVDAVSQEVVICSDLRTKIMLHMTCADVPSFSILYCELYAIGDASLL